MVPLNKMDELVQALLNIPVTVSNILSISPPPVYVLLTSTHTCKNKVKTYWSFMTMLLPYIFSWKLWELSMEVPHCWFVQIKGHQPLTSSGVVIFWWVDYTLVWDGREILCHQVWVGGLPHADHLDGTFKPIRVHGVVSPGLQVEAIPPLKITASSSIRCGKLQSNL